MQCALADPRRVQVQSLQAVASSMGEVLMTGPGWKGTWLFLMVLEQVSTLAKRKISLLDGVLTSWSAARVSREQKEDDSKVSPSDQLETCHGKAGI